MLWKTQWLRVAALWTTTAATSSQSGAYHRVVSGALEVHSEKLFWGAFLHAPGTHSCCRRFLERLCSKHATVQNKVRIKRRLSATSTDSCRLHGHCRCSWFDLVVVLQTDNSVLWERLEKR